MQRGQVTEHEYERKTFHLVPLRSELSESVRNVPRKAIWGKDQS
jgi:hypothetical protein